MPRHMLRGIGPPSLKQHELIDYIFRPDPDNIKQVDLCCGRGYGKTVLAIDIAVRTLNLDGNQVVLFLEPDWKRINKVFLKKWRKIVPPELYNLNKSEQCITWFNGALLFYAPRNITGSQAMAEDSQLGQDTTAIIDDEAALKCNRNMYINNLATIREPSPVRYYLTLSTPRVGPYKRLVTSPGHKLFRGTSRDNPYRVKNYVENLIANMSPEQKRREIDGEFVALEGRIWKNSDINTAWPNGNRHDQHTKFDDKKPWWLFCDLGGANGAYVIVQKTDPIYRGRRLFRGPVWVAVADLCPYLDASASRAFQIIDQHFGLKSGGKSPVGVVAGNDVTTRDQGSGLNVAYFAKKIWSNIPIHACDERDSSKQMQYDQLSYGVYSFKGERRFTVARNFVSLDDQSKRGVREMFEEDEWPPESQRRLTDFLPKNRDNRVQHTRDALMMGAVEIMFPPSFGFSSNPAG